jgi:sugar lactone lactonase YvrE
MGLAFDNAGSLYIADSGEARVRVVHPSGSITTFAGTGVRGFGGDGGPATSAQLTSPMGVVVDDTGNVHITDGSGARIRVVHPSGSIETYAGTGVPGFNGDGPVGTAQVNRPVGLAKDPGGRLYVTDRDNNRVRRFIGNGFPLAVTSVNKPDESFTVYPNPGKGTFYINLTSTSATQVHYIVTNLLGQKITELTAPTGTTTQMQLSAPAGIYLLTAETAGSRTTTRIVIAP